MTTSKEPVWQFRFSSGHSLPAVAERKSLSGNSIILVVTIFRVFEDYDAAGAVCPFPGKKPTTCHPERSEGSAWAVDLAVAVAVAVDPPGNAILQNGAFPLGLPLPS
jgi:hypothetical protein